MQPVPTTLIPLFNLTFDEIINKVETDEDGFFNVINYVCSQNFWGSNYTNEQLVFDIKDCQNVNGIYPEFNEGTAGEIPLAINTLTDITKLDIDNRYRLIAHFICMKLYFDWEMQFES